jgi:hypothetical protein
MGFGNPSPGDIQPRQRHPDELITSRNGGRDKSFGTRSPESVLARPAGAVCPQHEERHAELLSPT